ncbi:MAG: cell wall hydrolase [Beijerinckiaceae bacterium]|nr:cell wall hydrolase [Beijerinckiaceae bacterium]
MGCSKSAWAAGVLAPWCLGIAVAAALGAGAGEDFSSGRSRAPQASQDFAPPADLIPAQSAALGVDFGGLTGEARKILRQASLTIGSSDEFRRLPDEVEPRAGLKRGARAFPEIDRSRRGDPFTGLRPAFETRLRRFLRISPFQVGELIFGHDETRLAGGFAVANVAETLESAAAFAAWPEGESPAAAHEGAGTSPSQQSSTMTMRPAALNERLKQGATPAIRRAVTLGSATPTAPDTAPVEVAAFLPHARRPTTRGEGYARARQNYAVLAGQDEAAREQRCLAEAIYFEARGEPEEGQAAVAQVVLNRVASGLYPATICAVVYQNRQHYQACQFSFACDGRSLRITEPAAWERAVQIASGVTKGTAYVAEIGSSTHFHANYTRPRWSRRLEKMDAIGHHIFYKLRPGQS